MSQIPMQHRGKRIRIFGTDGLDEFMSMVLELTAELWVVKKRLYLLERAAGQADIELTQKIENYELSDAEIAELDILRRQMIATVLRSLESDHGARGQAYADTSTQVRSIAGMT